MARLTFWEKPGCGGNARQKALLAAAGHVLGVKSLLAEPWTPERLLQFLGPLPVDQWFNLAAPRVKSGEVEPARLSGEDALTLLLAEPLLIRRPLMELAEPLEDRAPRMVGFETERMAAWIGLAPAAPAIGEGCAAAAGHGCASQGVLE
jgi:nitrogenase-associated protein